MNIRIDQSPDEPDLTGCDREPIHIPGSIQPHGALLGVDADGAIRAAAGRCEEFFHLGPETLLGRPLASVFRDETGVTAGYAGAVMTSANRQLDLTRYASGDLQLYEFEPLAPSRLTGMALLQALEAATQSLDSAASVEDLCDKGARAFRSLTGFDRAMIYRFLEDGAGRVVGEGKQPNLGSFLHHHFPASDIPRQARALYLRNLTRIIPDSAYDPAPIVARGVDAATLDLSDSVLRSVSPIHLEYLQNMGVAASASVSIVMDGALWGLVALHNMTTRLLPNETRAVCRMLAGVLSRRLKAFDDEAFLGEQARLAAVRDAIFDELDRRGDAADGLADDLVELIGAVGADGVALCLDDRILTAGSAPPHAALAELRDWVVEEAGPGVLATERLSAEFEPGRAYEAAASGLLAIARGGAGKSCILWFRAERIEEVRWAGDPHKAVEPQPGARLTPRSSFEGWKETVRGRSRRWTQAEVEAAADFRRRLIALRRQREAHADVERLSQTVAHHEERLAQKDLLLKEVNHRIQNNLQLVASFLSLQRRETADPVLRAHLDEATRRMRAVGLVHRRLYHSDVVETVEMHRYLEELTRELVVSLGPEWEDMLDLDAQPADVPTDRAVAIGLVLTELVINVAKYAYEGRPGPVSVTFAADRRELSLVVADRGRGRSATAVSDGFGTRMMKALVAQIGGVLRYLDNEPGARAELTAPVG